MASLFPDHVTVAEINQMGKNSLIAHLEIEFTEIGPDYLMAKMPVSDKTKQPLGLLHGGASAALAETMGSMAANLVVAPAGKVPTGLEISANHIKPKGNGYVFGKATPVHLGRATHLWEIKITDEEKQLIAVSKITVAILDK